MLIVVVVVIVVVVGVLSLLGVGVTIVVVQSGQFQALDSSFHVQGQFIEGLSKNYNV